MRTYQQVIVFQRELVDQDPNNLQNKLDLAASYTNVGDVYQRMGKLDEALQYLNLARS